MSASLIVLIPVVLLGLVTVLCFTGCGLHTHGQAEYGPYQDAILTTSNLVAFWPLDDQPSPDVSQPEAAEIAPKQPPLFPFTGLYTGPDGSFALNQTGIVPGDVNNGLTPCASFSNGGSVQVMVQPPFDPSQTFTVEAWVQPAWPASDNNVHAVVVTTDLAGNTGYALFCDQNNLWTGNIGLGQGNSFLLTTAAATSQPATPGTGMVFYLALTFDGANLKLFVNPMDTNPYAQAPVANPMKLTPSTTPLFIGLGRPDMPPGQLPFNGKIQDVGFYSPALTDDVVLQHFALGNVPPG